MFPQAEDLARYWNNILNRVDAITDVPETHWSRADYFDDDPKAMDRTYAHRGGFLIPVDFPLLDFGISPHSVEATDTTQLLGLLVARQALEDAGLGHGNDDRLDREKVSVILGVTGTLELVIPLGARLGHPIWRRALAEAGVDKATADDVVDRIASSYVGWQENSFPGLLGNVAAGRIANRLDLKGTNCVVDAACASSLAAVNLAMLELAAGRCDIAVSGGLDTFNDIFMYMCFSKTPALSPTGDARPFDMGADGTILGEGLGVLVLKRLDDARRDGDRIYAVIRSVGSSSDGKGQAVYAPKALGQVKALEAAYQTAGITPGTIELVEAHGTGTKVGDATELAALEMVYGGARPGPAWCALGSVKSQVGHTKAAAGAAGMIKAALALHHKVLPPTCKISQPVTPDSGEGSSFYLPADARPWLSNPAHPRRAAVSAFGFGGSNFHCVLEEASPEKSAIDWGGDVQILAFSGDTPERIAAELDEVDANRNWPAIRALAARSRAAFQHDAPHRLVIVAEREKSDMDALVAVARERLKASDGANLETTGRSPAPHGRVVVGAGSTPGDLALLFPGQGSQYVGMLRELACRFPEMHEALTLANEQSSERPTPLLDLIYPKQSFGDHTNAEHTRALRETRIAQPAIGAVSLGLLRIVERLGIRPDMTAGHSFGELTALRAAGRIDDRELTALARRRGELMADCSSHGDSGGMLAVFAPIEEIRNLVDTHSLDLVIANHNAPRQCVISGPAEEIERARELFSAARVSTAAIAVSAAFHSRFVSHAREPFLESLRSLEFAPAAIPVYSNVTALPYPDRADEARELIAGQLANPVEFVAQIEAMYQAGARTFLEVGPDAKLSTLVQKILAGREHHAVAIDATRGAAGNLYDMGCALATLAALGYAVNLPLWDQGRHEVPSAGAKTGFTVKVSGANPRPAGRSGEESRAHAAVDRNGSAARAIAAIEPARRPRFVIPGRDPSAPPNAVQPLHRAETDRIMNPPEHRNAPQPQTHPHQNGHVVHQDLGIPGSHDNRPASRGEVSAAQSPGNSPGVAAALEIAQQNLIAMQKLAEQTAQLHRQFLEGQEKTQHTFRALLEQRDRLVESAPPRSEPRPSVGLNHVERPAPPALASPPEPQVMAPLYASPPGPTAPAAIPVATPAPAAQASSAASILLEVVAEKTGYPADVLDLDMQLDADLGIDSIKRVEILSALQERLGDLPSFQPEQLGSFRTLRMIADQIGAAAPAAGPAAAGNERPPAPPADDQRETLAQALLEAVAEKTGYPVDMLELDMRLDADLGIDSIKRVEIFSAIQDRYPDTPHAGPDQIGSLATLRDIAAFLARPTESARNTSARAESVTAASPPLAIGSVLIEAVAEKTGYPVDMLELDMRLDADLGIDSIKRVEILSAVQDRVPGAPALEPEQLGSLATLRQVADALEAGIKPATPAPQPPPRSQTARVSNRDGGSDNHVGRAVSSALEPANGTPRNGHAAPRGANVRTYYPHLSRLAADDRRPAARLSPGGTVLITDDGSALAGAIAAALAAHGQTPRVIDANDFLAIQAAVDHLAGLIVLAPVGPVPATIAADAFRLARAVAPALERAAARGGAAFMTVSRLDGGFGLAGLTSASNPIAGSLAGVAKTAGHEWPAVHCKAIDLDAGWNGLELAAAHIVDELYRRGPSEVGLSARGRTAITLEPLAPPAMSARRAAEWKPGDVIVITGGARGITAEVAAAFASEFRPRIVLLGRSPAPGAEADWLAGAHSEAELKAALIGRSGRGVSLNEVGDQVRRILADREIRQNLARFEAAGSTCVYHQVDVRDAEAVRRCLQRVQEQFGPIKGLIHGAGVLADRRIVDQTDAQFDLVYDTKVAGLENLLESVDRSALRLLALFSSSTARFGRVGQVAYAAANEVLNKRAERLARELASCRVISFNWGPWAGGMVTDALRGVFESEGIGLIPLADGARLVVDAAREGVTAGPVEVVVLAELKHAERPAVNHGSKRLDLNGSDRGLETVATIVVGVGQMPVLRSHVIDGRAVVPLALIIEWLAAAAIQRNPGLAFVGLDHVQLYKGVVLDEDQSEQVDLRAAKATRTEGEYRVTVELGGTIPGGRMVVHARAEAILADRQPEGNRTLAEIQHPPLAVSREAMYESMLFHGPALHGIERVDGIGPRGLSAWAMTAPLPAEWFERPHRSQWLTDPLAIDCAFQLMVVWCRDQLGASSLPTSLGGYRQFRREFPLGGVQIRAEIRQSSELRARADIEFVDAAGELVARIDAFECAIDPALNQAFRHNQLARALTLSRVD
jgi:acyl transferase domain-containing protein/NAD(P)-dependent dehydrogenase (short-subunit alcohol dehydrogenase family)